MVLISWTLAETTFLLLVILIVCGTATQGKHTSYICTSQIIILANYCFQNYVSPHVTAVETCSGHSFLASCQSDEVVVMTSALYGRMSIGKCVERNMGALGCRSDVIDIAHNACSGRRRCELRVRNPDMDRRMRAEASCANATELSRYLDAEYRCQQGTCAAGLLRSAGFHIHNNSLVQFHVASLQFHCVLNNGTRDPKQ